MLRFTRRCVLLKVFRFDSRPFTVTVAFPVASPAVQSATKFRSKTRPLFPRVAAGRGVSPLQAGLLYMDHPY